MPSLLRRLRRIPRALAILLALGASVAAARAGAQRGYFRPSVEPNAEYDGQFTFVRLRYTGWSGRWIADYPAMERNFMTILNDLTTVHPRVGQSNILSWDDPELSRYAVAYVCEPGFWQPTEDEARAQQLMKQRETDFNRLEDDADTVITDEGTAEITEDEEIEPAETE